MNLVFLEILVDRRNLVFLVILDYLHYLVGLEYRKLLVFLVILEILVHRKSLVIL